MKPLIEYRPKPSRRNTAKIAETAAKIETPMADPFARKSLDPDLATLRATLTGLLGPSETAQLDKLFTRLERQRVKNAEAQAAWRARQKANK